MLLGLIGHTVEVAGSGPAGVQKGDPAPRATRLLALSGYSAPEDIARAREAGFDAHLAKPPSLDKLEEILDRAWYDVATAV